jgi:tannase
MYSSLWKLILTTASIAAVQAAPSLADVCTIPYVTAHLPPADVYPGISILSSSVTANPVYNVSVEDQTFYPNAVFDYCNVTFKYARKFSVSLSPKTHFFIIHWVLFWFSFSFFREK